SPFESFEGSPSTCLPTADRIRKWEKATGSEAIAFAGNEAWTFAPLPFPSGFRVFPMVFLLCRSLLLVRRRKFHKLVFARAPNDVINIPPGPSPGTARCGFEVRRHRLQAAKYFSTSSRVGKAVIAPLADTASPPETAAKAAKCSSLSKE